MLAYNKNFASHSRSFNVTRNYTDEWSVSKVVRVVNCRPKYVTGIFSVEYLRDLEMLVRGRSRSLKMAPFDRSHTSSYSSSIVAISVSCTAPRALASPVKKS